LINIILALSIHQTRGIPGTIDSSAQDGDIRPFLEPKSSTLNPDVTELELSTPTTRSRNASKSPAISVPDDSGSEDSGVNEIDLKSDYDREREGNLARNKVIFDKLAMGYKNLFDDCKRSVKGRKKLDPTKVVTALSILSASR
jgi:hypothetical protein